MNEVLKNHIAIVLDVSGSMYYLTDKVEKVFNNQIKYLRESSLRFEQETRVSVYTFSGPEQIQCLISDVDVARPMELPRLSANGSTALMDAVGLSVEDLKLLPEKYGSHAFLIYLITDGQENTSRKYTVNSFNKLIKSLPSNYSVVGFVPDNNGVRELKNYGFPEGNIDKWDLTERGVEEVGEKINKSVENYFTARRTGVKSLTNMISSLSDVNAKNVNKILDEVTKYNVVINEAVKAVEIRDLVESKTKIRYTKGCAYYELVKTETVQPTKQVAIQNKKNGKIYTGDNARQLLSLPDYDIKIKPEHDPEWIVYIQSTSVNRKVIPKQRILVV